MQNNRALNYSDLETVINKFLDHLCEQNKDLKPMIEKNRANLVQDMCKLLEECKPEGLGTKDLGNKAFLKTLSVALVYVISLSKDLNQNKKLLDDDLMKKLKDIFSDPKKLAELKKDPKALEKMLGPEDMKKLKDAVSKHCDTLLKDLEKAGIVKPTPGKSPKEEMTKGFDPYENLFGLANSYSTGSIPVVVQSYIGNGLGFNDWNPNNGLANIDRVNNASDNQQGDPLALNASTMGNFLQFNGDSIIDSFQKELQADNLAAPSSPRPEPGRH